MENKKFENAWGGATLLSRYSKGFDGIGLVKILRYYGTKIVRRNIRKSNAAQHSYVRRESVILNCLRQDIKLNIGGTCHVILNLIQDLRIPPTLTLPPSLRSGNRVAQLVPRWLPLFLKGGREKLVSEAHSNHKPHYTHLTHFIHSKKAAFTLAEVLITLGIIGIVAAMTIPTLISNYQKKEVATKLKQTYSILSQALQMAQVEKGDTTTWAVNDIYGTDVADTNFSVRDVTTDFVKSYLIPNLKVSKDYGYTTNNAIGYDGLYYAGNSNEKRNRSGYMFLLSNNVLIQVGVGTSGCIGTTLPDGSCDGKREYRNIVFWVDINGFQKPNMDGKDVFLMTFNVQKKVFGFHKYGDVSRDKYLEFCKSSEDAQVCGYLIFMDNWEIKDDYPWY